MFKLRPETDFNLFYSYLLLKNLKINTILCKIYTSVCHLIILYLKIKCIQT